MLWKAFLSLIALFAAPPVSAAEAAGEGQPERVEIVLTDFAFTPRSLHLRAGRPYLLHFVNRGSGGHNFAARAFFAAATIQSGKPSKKGVVELKKGASTDIALTPARGSYPVKCTHFLHTSFGMIGEVVVN